jgi:tape measure domain-containing protein
MATLEAMFKLFDGYSSTANKVINKTDQATNKILKASGATDNFNTKLKSTGSSANSASIGLGKFVSLAATLAGAIKGMNIADEYTNTASRLSLINDGLQTQSQLQNKIFAAADRAKGSYSSMADSVAKLQLNAKEQFKTNDEAIAFTELLQKSFKISGASSSERDAGTLQLTQAMGAGKLQGDEFRSIMENAPMVADAIARYTGKTKGQLKQMSTDGQITADIIKNAMFSASNDINKKFAKMPYTFSDVWNKIKNGATRAFSSTIERINKQLNSVQGKKLVDDIIKGIYVMSDVVGSFINFVISNWPTIKTILQVITAVYLVTMVSKLWETVSALVAQAAAWITAYWPILLVIGAIALVIAISRKCGATWEEIIGTAGGTVGAFAGLFSNKLVMLWNKIAALGNFFGNFLKNPAAAVGKLIYDLVINLIGYLQTFASAMDKVSNKFFGTKNDVAGEIGKFKGKLEVKMQDYVNKTGWKQYVDYKQYKPLDKAYDEGSKKSVDIYKDIEKTYNKEKEKIKKLLDELKNAGKDTSKGPVKVEGTGAGNKVKIDMSDEDLQYLRDIAERDYINKFSSATLAPKVSISFGDVRETADVNKVKGILEKMMREEIAVAAEGDY